MDISKMIQASIEEKIQNGELNHLIDTKATAFLTDIIDDSFRSYAVVGNEIKQKIETEVLSSLKDATFENFAELLLSTMEQAVKDNNDQYAKQLTDHFVKNYVGQQEDLKLSHIVELVKQEIDFDMDDVRELYEDYEEMTLVVEKSSYGSAHVYIDRKPEVRTHNCEVKLFLLNDEDSYKLVSAEIQKKDWRCIGRSYNAIGAHSSDLERALQLAYTKQTNIILDENDADISVELPEDY